MRRLAALILYLPPTSAVARIHQTAADRWTQDHELLATLITVVDAASLRLVKLFAKKGTKLPKPVHVDRPYETKRPKPMSMSDPRVRAFFGSVVRYSPPKDTSTE